MKIVRPREIAAARRRAKITQKDLAALLGVTQQYVSRIECGREPACSDKLSRDIARRLDLDLDRIFKAPKRSRRRRTIPIDKAA